MRSEEVSELAREEFVVGGVVRMDEQCGKID